MDHSFIKQFDIHSSSSVSSHSRVSHMTDMMENKCLQMQESLSHRIQMLEDKFEKTSLDRSRISHSKEFEPSKEESSCQQQRMMDLQQFVDRVDTLVWNTPWLSPVINTEHVCDRHRAWSERIIQERQKAVAGQPYSKERLEATMDRLMEWAESIRRNNQQRR
ncbi:hypothetical protein BC941DRAFT_443801 [Chlamydoabsidia padenii]|nr:hypothetical protein BC941DRAFT_443801 [Chlamydoabsidia padenii]